MKHRPALWARRLAPGLLTAALLTSPSAQHLGTPARLVPNQSLALPSGLPGAFQVGLLLGEEYRVLDLHGHSVRAPEYQLYMPDSQGRLRTTAPAAPSTYRGTIAGREGSRVAGWLSADGLHALVLDGEDTWVVEPQRGAAGRDLHFVGRFDELPPIDLPCGVVREAWDEVSEHDIPSGAADGSGPALAEIAYDADSVYVADHGGDVEAAQAEIEGTIAQASLIYELYMDIQYEVSGAVIRTSANDPYIQAGLTWADPVQDWWLKLQSQWNNPSLPEHSIPGDLVHLFSGHSIFGDGYSGWSMFASVCVQFQHFAVNGHQALNAGNVMLFAHEAGHNWNACHCDQAGCPVATDCGIMKSVINPFAPIFFGSQEIAQILAYKASVGCLGTGTPSPAPSLTSVSPAEVQALDDGRLTLSGTDMDKAMLVHIGAESFDFSDFAVVDDQTLELLAPRATALGLEDVSVSGPGGTSSVQQFEYVETSPPKLVADFYPTWGFDAIWSYGGEVGKTGRLLLAFNPTTTTISGFQVLLNANTADIQVLADPGIATYSRAIPQALAGATLYMQVLLIDGSTLVDVSAIEAYPIAP